MRVEGRALVLGLFGLLGVGCGGPDGGGFITEPPPEEEEAPPPPPAPAILGDTIIALDLSNRLLVFGAESSGALNRVIRIRGVSILNRIVGIDFRRSTGDLYGVGSDSRVYIIDVETGDATAVSSERFSPPIISFFDIHFGMAMHPKTDQIRLISAESGTSWSIDPDDGTAVTDGGVRFDDADIHAGMTPTITGLSYALPTVDLPLAPSDVGGPYKSAIIADCDDALLYAFDADLAWVLGTCDPAGIDFESLLDIDMAVARCSSVAVAPDGNLFGSLLNLASEVNEWASIDPETGEITWGDPVPAPSPVQDFAFIFQVRDLDPPLLDRASPASTAALYSKRFGGASTDPVLSGEDGLAQCRGGGAPVE